MKKIMVMFFVFILVPCFAFADVRLSWVYDYDNPAGFIVYFWKSGTPETVYNKTIENGMARSLDIPIELFQPGTEYSFEATAYNNTGESDRSSTAIWTSPGESYVPPADKLPSVLYIKPEGIDTIVISIP